MAMSGTHDKERYRRFLLCGAGGVLTLFLLLYLFSSPLFTFYLNRQIDRFNNAYRAELTVKHIRLKGLTTVMMTGISLRAQERDTLLKIDTVMVSVNLLKLIAGRVSIQNVELMNTRLALVRHDTITNYMFLLQKQSQGNSMDTPGRPPDSLSPPVDYALITDRLTRLVFNKIPHSINLSGFRVSSLTNGHQLNLEVDRFNIRDHHFRSVVRVKEDSLDARWLLEGNLDNHNRLAEFRLFSTGTSKVTLPFLDYKWRLGLSFDTLSFSIVVRKTQDDRTNIYGSVTVYGLEVDHEKIASTPVTFDHLGMTYAVNVGSDFVELDSNTLVTFNRLDFHPYIRYCSFPAKQLTLKVNKPDFPAQKLFSSLPSGLFVNLDGIRVSGNLSYCLNFFVDLSQPDSLLFESELKRHQFRVISYGNADLTRINAPFLYTAYERGEPVRSFMVGPENPGFRLLDRISPYLQVSVLCSEDGGFYQHRGFLPEAIRESIITNIRERRFARGGSTISMQLVKNVFLSRNKTIARKLEEILIVWLIENQGLCTKDRMYEVYLNIIEWGPMVYGANEASRFYFNKDASKLTLAESIFLASIIPRPKWFRYSFDENGRLRDFNLSYYQLVSGKMLRKGWITQQDYDRLTPDVELKGPARWLLKKGDTVPADTVRDQTLQDI